MSTTKIDKITKKIAALLQKAESAKELGSIAEFEAFTAHANKLIIEYNIEQSKIDALNGEEKFAKYGKSSMIFYDGYWGSQWRYKLAMVLSEHNFCTFTTKTRSRNLTFYGDMTNVENVVWLYHFLNMKLQALAVNAWKTHLKRKRTDPVYKLEAELMEALGSGTKHQFGKAFLLGVVQGIDIKLNEEKEKSELANEINSLMIVNKEALREYIDLTVKNLRRDAAPQKLTYMSDQAYKAGIDTGKNIEFNERKLSSTEEQAKSKMLS
ncbi:gp66 [Sphingomonas phage PAU]|uniref:hypothetical protein n=1 Tax=Sphingomonas phage PAU TaxID=1150991 RepID=UPI00025731CC|nr:hypothetical protein F405_gp238 [Sphingomonas phage PAU]AFF28064.1 gp66 [Sphingomonas phage PAU]